MRTRDLLGYTLAGLLFAQSLCPLQAAEGKRLAVTGFGKVEVRPDVMELTATVTGNAELTADALKKFRDNRRRGIDAVKKLKIDGLEVKGGGVSVISNAAVQQFQQRFGNGGQNQPGGRTTFSETLTFAVPGIDRLKDDQVQDLATKILDAAKDAGLTMGQPTDYQPYYNYNNFKPQVVFFRLGKPEESRLKAMDEAAQDARKKATEMAKRLGLEIGKPVSARDASSRHGVTYQANVYVQTNRQTEDENSATLSKIPVEAVLAVEYEILK